MGKRPATDDYALALLLAGWVRGLGAAPLWPRV